MELKIAHREALDAVMEFYYNLIDSMKDARFRPGWKKDIYPTRQFMEDSIARKELLLAYIGDTIVGALVLNHDCAPGYHKVRWAVDAHGDEVAVVHALGVAWQAQGQGIAKRMLVYVADLCVERGLKAIRLDVLASNQTAQKLYPAVGYIYMDTIQLFYEDTGLTDFLLYELVL